MGFMRIHFLKTHIVFIVGVFFKLIIIVVMVVVVVIIKEFKKIRNNK